MFYEQLMQVKIPKAQKDTEDLTVFFCFWEQLKKNCSQNVVEIDNKGQFHQHFGA